MDKVYAEELSDRVINRGKKEAKAAPLGKKDQAKQAAKDVGGKYAPPEAPRFIN